MELSSSRVTAPSKPRSSLIFTVSVALGALLAFAWSYRFVDSVVADGISRAILKESLLEFPLENNSAGLLFALISGMAGTFTACNICVFTAAVPMASRTRPSLGSLINSMSPFLASLLIVSAMYGVLGVLGGYSIPQLSASRLGDGEMPIRLIQSGVVFVVLGIILFYWGALILRSSSNVPRSVWLTSSTGAQIILGSIVAAFLIGRPFPPFRRMFEYAIETGNPLYGGISFALQALGNVAFVIIFVGFISVWRGGVVVNWFQRYNRQALGAAAGFLMGGTFMILYWGIRVPARFVLEGG